MSALPVDSLAYSLAQAARIVAQVMQGGSLAEGPLDRIPRPARPAVQDLVYGGLREYGRTNPVLAALLNRALPDNIVRALLHLAIVRLEQRPDSAHTTVDQAVAAAAEIAGGRFKGLTNAVLRNYLRQRETLQQQVDASREATGRHPAWWLDSLVAAYPSDWPKIVTAGNMPPPMALRVNRRKTTRDAYRAALAQAGIEAVPRGPDGLLLTRPLPVDALPGFAEGLASVQDLGAQRAAELLKPADGSRVLDACAAPGGKTAHLLETADLRLSALDLKPARCRRIEENLARLELQAEVRCADCTRVETWWDGQAFDAVLADVPCSASGVVRRHPDVKWLRRPADLASFAAAQALIVDRLWQVLRPGGTLLYVTCSVFPEENELQMASFVARTPGAVLRQEEHWLPDPEHDGFYYCLVTKSA